MLLDRVEQLERRVAELETKGTPTANPAESLTGASTAEVAVAQPKVPGAVDAPAATVTAAETAAVTAPGPSINVIPADKAIPSLSAQATEKGKSGGAKVPASEPFAFADFTWLNGNARTKESPMDTKFFTPEIRADVDYVYDFNHPKDDTIGGSSEVFRSDEVQVTQLGVGGDFHFDNVRARVMTQFGLYSETTPRNDASPARGQWNLNDAYRYLSEAYGGYHFNVLHGINVDAGIFMSYIGLFSYYNFDNWAYQPSYVSSNTPWFFNGVRVQIFPTEHLKIEPWFVNGWQSYGRFNNRPGFGMQILWRPNGWFSILGNQYALGEDAFNTPGRVRYHTDDSIEVKYYDRPGEFVDKMAFSLTGDLGCEHGGGVSCAGNSAKGPKQSFLGFMLYDRTWFHNDKFGLTLGGGKINNPGRYLVSAAARSMERPHLPERRTLRKIRAIRSRRGMRRRRLTGCRASTLHSGGNSIIAPRMCRTSRGLVASRRRLVRPQLSATTFAVRRGRSCPGSRRISRRLRTALILRSSSSSSDPQRTLPAPKRVGLNTGSLSPGLRASNMRDP